MASHQNANPVKAIELVAAGLRNRNKPCTRAPVIGRTHAGITCNEPVVQTAMLMR